MFFPDAKPQIPISIVTVTQSASYFPDASSSGRHVEIDISVQIHHVFCISNSPQKAVAALKPPFTCFLWNSFCIDVPLNQTKHGSQPQRVTHQVINCSTPQLEAEKMVRIRREKVQQLPLGLTLCPEMKAPYSWLLPCATKPTKQHPLSKYLCRGMLNCFLHVRALQGLNGLHINRLPGTHKYYCETRSALQHDTRW